MANRAHPNTVITSHPNADLDALGSMVAARHLHPGAVAAWSQGTESQVATLLQWLGAEAPSILEPHQLSLEFLSTLILVDTKSLSRLGPFSELSQDSAVRLVIYDHHPEAEEELPEHAEIYTLHAGSNTSGLVDLLRRKELSVAPMEATVMSAGVFEDTGMLTYAGVTEADFEAGRWLLAQGADLGLVGRLLRRELAPEQVELFHQLLEAAHRVTGLHQRVLLAAVEDPEKVRDAAEVVQRVLDSLDAVGFLALIQQGKRVVAIGRSRPNGPDMRPILAELGGGGHAYAGSASLPNVPLAEAHKRAESALRQQEGEIQTVGELASRPVHCLPAGLTVAQAAERMGRYPLSRMPVVDNKGRPAGWVDRALLDRARAHGLGEQALEAYVAPMATVGPGDPLNTAATWILDRDYPLVGIVEEGRLTAVLTRSDLIRYWREGFNEAFELESRLEGQKRDFRGRLRAMLDAATVDILRQFGDLAAKQGMRAFLVGGLVRDLVLRRFNSDLDIAVEGNAIALAEAFAKQLGWYVHTHRRFGTAVLKGPKGQRLDVTTSRIEHYPYPAALPEVEAGSIKADLFRRDFTINALAVELDGPRFGRLLDPFGGLQDIRQGVIRVLHSLSFVEDPTRIIRAVRFETELGFRIDGTSERLIRNAVELGLPARLSGSRLFRELRYLLATESPAKGLQRLDRLALLPFFHPILEGEGGKAAVIQVGHGEEVLSWYRLLYREEEPLVWKVLLLLLLWELSPEALEAVLRRYELRSREATGLGRDRKRATQFARALRQGALDPEDDIALFEALEELSLEGLLACMAASEEHRVRAGISHYLQHLRGMRPALNGRQLQALGIPEGPAIGKWLRILTRARIQGQVHDVEEEKALVQSGEIPS